MLIIQAFKKRVHFYSHDVYRLSYGELLKPKEDELSVFAVNMDNLDSVHASRTIRSMMKKQKQFIEGFGFTDIENNTVGHIYLMKRGGKEALYRIKSIDAYVFAVRVFEEFRGKRYAGEMIAWLSEMLHERGIDEIYLTVKKTNAPAIKAYERIGFRKIGEKRFLRVWRINIPYYSL